SGRRAQVSPGARMRGMVTMKFSPVRIDENPLMKMPSAVGTTFVVEAEGLKGGEKGQPGSTPPLKIAQSVTAAPSMNKDQLARLRRGKARSRAPIISGTRKLPSTVGIEGIKKNQTMMTPCTVNSLL